MFSTVFLTLVFSIVAEAGRGSIRQKDDKSPLTFFVSPSGSDSNDGTSRSTPFLTLSKAAEEAIASDADKSGGSITLMKGRHIWEEVDGIVDGLIGPSSENPFHIKADDIDTVVGEGVLLDGSDMLPPLSEWKDDQQGMFCTKSNFHPSKDVNELWFTGIESVTGGDNVLGIRAQHPNVLGGDRDSPEAWPVPSDPQEREYPLPGSMWDKSARLGNNGEETLGLIDCSEVVLSPPPFCFSPNYALSGNRCTNGCQQITGKNVKSAAKRCPLGLPDCPERYHEAFKSHPDPKNTNSDMNDCPSAFPSCDRNSQDTWPWCLDLHNIGYVSDPMSEMDYNPSGGSNPGEIYVTACVDKKLLGPFPIVAHDIEQGKIYFNYTNFAVNRDKPAKQTSLWEGMTSCWKYDADKIEEITGGKVKTDWFRTEQKPKYKVVSRAVFDNALEWWHDGPGEELCVRVEDSSLSVRVKQRGSMLRLQGSENVKVSGLRLFATEFQAESKNGIGFSNTFDNMIVEYPGEIQLNPATVINSVFQYGKGIIKTTGPVLDSNGKPTRCVFMNNLIEYGEMGVELTDCAGGDITHNTIHHIYNGDAFEIYKHGCDCDDCEWDHDKCMFEVAFNRIYDVGFNGHCDCSGFQTKFGVVKEMQLHHNWVYSLPYHKGIRLDTGENGANIYENVIWNTAKGATFKGGTIEGHQIVQNTAFGSKDVDFSVIEYEYGTGSTTPWKPYNTKSIVYNNAVDDWRDSGNRKCTEPVCVESPGYALKQPKLKKPWIDRWERCDKNDPIPCHNDWKEMSYWLQEFNKKTQKWVDTGVEVDDPGCQSGPLGKYNSLNYGTCTESKSDWITSGSWPQVHEMLRDVANYDFRPKQHGDLVGKGKGGAHFFYSKDIGAYEAEATGLHYNIPGHVETSASSPVPPNGSFNVLMDADLMFMGGLNAKKHLIFLSTSFCDVATDNSKKQQELSSPSNIYIPNDSLEIGLTYYWRVDTVRNDNTVLKGAVWCFEVAESSVQHKSTLSWNLRTNKSSCTSMNIKDHCGSCKDDSSFRFNGDPTKTCEWVKAKKTEKRCKQTDNSNKLVKQSCPLTCSNCYDDPDDNECEDDESFMLNGDPKKTCDWIKNKPTNRCKKMDEITGEAAAESCPVVCDNCPEM